MGKDLIHKRCLGDNVRYADLLNGLLFAGEQVVKPTDLVDVTTGNASKKQRDLLKKVALGTNFIVLGVENQEKVHYLMPLRSMLYDAQEYDRQARAIRREMREKSKAQKKVLAGAADAECNVTEAQEAITEAEYLSGFRKIDRLRPCITIVLYYGDDWDGSKDLHGILDMSAIPEDLKKYVNNYPMHLFEVKKFTDRDTDVFRTDLKQIFDFIRCSKDEEKLHTLVKNNPVYREMDEDAYDMVAAYANTKALAVAKETYRKDGKVDMCKAIEDMCQHSWQEGIEQGIRLFILDHKEDGTLRERVLDKLVRRFELTPEKAESYLLKYNY